MAESFTTPHSLPILGTSDLVRSPSGDNIRKQINALATATASAISAEGAKYIPAWKAATVYSAGQRVIAPNGDVVSAKADHTSGASYTAANWNASSQDGRIAGLEGRELPDRGRAVPATFSNSANNITQKGVWAVWTSGDATLLGLPLAVAGRIHVEAYGNVVTQEFHADASAKVVVYSRKSAAGTWGSWGQMGATDSDVSGFINDTASATTTSLNNRYAPTKVAAVSLTTGDGGGVETVTSRSFRLPVRLAADVQKFRVHIQNTNPRYGNRYAGALTFTGLGIAPHAGTIGTSTEGQLGELTTIDSGFVTNASGYEYISPWVTGTPIKAYTTYMLTGGYTCAAQNNAAMVGGGWVTADAADWNVTAPAALTLTQKVPLYIWLELVIDGKVKVIAYPGDSLASGVSARLPVFDSMPNRHALAYGHIPTIYANSGTTMAEHLDSAHPRWTRYDTAKPARPDGVWWEMGSNDVFTPGTTQADLQSRLDTCLTITRQKLSTNIGLMTVLPRLDAASAQEPVRKAWNEYLLTNLPGNAVMTVDAAAPLTNADGSTLDTRFSAGAGDIHLTAAGYARYMKDLPPLHT